MHRVRLVASAQSKIANQKSKIRRAARLAFRDEDCYERLPPLDKEEMLGGLSLGEKQWFRQFTR
jgi:hypothetical protein